MNDLKREQSINTDHYDYLQATSDCEVIKIRFTVGVSECKVTKLKKSTVVTYALGSCIGIAIHDPVAQVGGILHFMLPMSSVDRQKAENNPCMFGDTGIPYLFKTAYKCGATKKNLRVVMAGGGKLFEKKDFFDIGNRNIVIARKLFWKNQVMIAAENVGGQDPRTLYLDCETGETWFTTHGQRYDL